MDCAADSVKRDTGAQNKGKVAFLRSETNPEPYQTLKGQNNPTQNILTALW